MSAVFLSVLDPALEGTSDERGAATLRASQHAHGTGFAGALDDGQALVLDETREGVGVVEADDARHEVIARCAQPPVQVLGREGPAGLYLLSRVSAISHKESGATIGAIMSPV